MSSATPSGPDRSSGEESGQARGVVPAVPAIPAVPAQPGETRGSAPVDPEPVPTRVLDGPAASPPPPRVVPPVPPPGRAGPDSSREPPAPGGIDDPAGGTGCPYPGLAGFDAASERWFFGRERMVIDLVVQVRTRLTAGGPLVLVGASGSGKSSLLRAGLLPVLARGAVPGSDTWPQVLMTPGEHPVRSLLDQIAGVGIAAAVSGTDAELPQRLTEILASHPGGGVVIAVDQFEEIFTSCDDPSERETFVRALCAAAAARDDRGPAAVVVLGLRADFYARCAAYPELVEALQTGQVVVGPMTAGEIRDIVVKPARTVGVDVEPGLVELLLRDLGAATATSAQGAVSGAGVVADPGSLPLLAHALRSTWFARESSLGGNSSPLTVGAYLRIGGLTGAIAQTAEGAYTGLAAGAQQAARPLLMRMVRLGEGEQDSRRRVRRADLLAAVPAREAEAVLDALVAARLVEADTEGDGDSLQIAHEALLRSWPRLREWMDVDRAAAIALQQLGDAAETWDRGARDPSYLFGGTRLAAAREWVESQPDQAPLSPVARAFYDESLRVDLAAQQAAVRRTRRLRRLVAVTTVLALVAASLAGLAYRQGRTAAAARDRALSQRIANQADLVRGPNPAIAAQLSLVAYRKADTPEARGSVLSSFNGGSGVPTRYLFHRNAVGAVTYSPNGKLIATGSDDWATAIWDAADPRRSTPLAVLPGPRDGGHTRAVKSVAFSRDSTLLATGSGDRTAKIWDVSTPSRPRLLATLPEATGDVYGLAFSPAADRLAVGGYGNSARIYDVSDPARPTLQGALLINNREPLHRGPIDALAFSPDGTFLAAGDDAASAVLWWVGPGLRIGPVGLLNAPAGDPTSPRVGAIRAVAFGPDGHSVYTAGAAGRIRVFSGPNLLHLTHTATLGVGNDPMTTLAVAPRGGLVAAGGNLFDGVPLYDPAATTSSTAFTDTSDGERPLTFLDEGAVTWTVAFSPDGRHLASGSADGALRVWEIPGPALIGRHGEQQSSEVNPRTGDVVTVSYRAAELWNIADPYHPASLSAITDDLADDGDVTNGAAFRPDGQLLAVGTAKRVCLYDITDPRRPSMISTFAGPVGGVFTLRFSPDGRTLVLGGLGAPPASSFSTELQTWDVRDPRHPARLAAVTAHRDNVRDIKFSQDGRIMVSVADRSVRLWDVRDPRRIVPQATLPDFPGEALRAAFSPDGRTLAVGGGGPHATLWNVADPSRPALITSLSGHVSQVNTVTFSPDGRTLVTGSLDNSVRVWDVQRLAHPKLVERLSRSGGTDTGIGTIDFSRDGSTLIGTVFSQPATLWDLDVKRVAQRVCTQAGVGITRAEWARFLPDQAYDPPCD
ncbi:WD40 repeat domain-containing protein [Frankia sp. AvcI1]|uniref:NACHT and WD repeat domain-containing protein n=1 Tax=Frankia sp. AvcI1 TaxID=573496 RepID=UPI0021192695|nr:WD40 repeat domain-containing protein [Frankia sp. AvcI1]